MAEQAIVAFDSEGFRFRLDVFFRWHEVLIGFPIVRHDLGNQRTLHRIPQLLPSYAPSGASASMEKALSKSINSNPDPAVVFLCPT